MTETPEAAPPQPERRQTPWDGIKNPLEETDVDWLKKQLESLESQLRTERRARKELEDRFKAANLEEDPAVINARRHLFRQIMHLVPQAIAEAKGIEVSTGRGKTKKTKRGPSRPALLRLIVRTVRLR